ncbi:MAG: LLM class flavin-dependent oxidoreductase [Gammaproteobacteria bacterium]
MKFGLTLANRQVALGTTTPADLLSLAVQADTEGCWDSVWVGDSLFAKPRLDALTLLGALAGVTENVRLGPACFASTPLRPALLLSYQWASLDLLSGGRTVFVACQGQGAAGGGRFGSEFEALGIDPRTRMRRMEEAIEVLRLTTGADDVSYAGEFNAFEHVTIAPPPVQRPVPIWIAANPHPDQPRNRARALGRVAKLADGWMTTRYPPPIVAQYLDEIRGYAKAHGRTLGGGFEVALYYNINVNDDERLAYEQSKAFLDEYYMTDYSQPHVRDRVALGPPQACIDSLRAFEQAGVSTVTLRLLGPDIAQQYRRVVDQVLPAFI